MKILLVDDAMIMRAILKNILLANISNIEFIEAANGIDGVECYKAETPNLVLMDITMPKMNGIEALQNIMEYDKNASVIMCSAMGQEIIVLEALKLGAKDFIIKPFDKKSIISSVSKLIGI